MFENRLHEQIEKAIEYMHERCNHFYMRINTTNFKFILLSSIEDEYKHILNCDRYCSINYKYFIGLKENANKLINGLYSLNKESSIYEEELKPHYPESKYGEHIIEDKNLDTINQSISSYSDYRSGEWSDLEDLYSELRHLSNCVLDSEYIKEENIFWDDGTYEFTFYKNNLTLKDKFIINKYMIEDDIENINLYEDVNVFFEYNWKNKKGEHKIKIKNNRELVKKQVYTIGQYDLLTNFNYVEPIAKSEYLFDFSKTTVNNKI